MGTFRTYLVAFVSGLLGLAAALAIAALEIKDLSPLPRGAHDFPQESPEEQWMIFEWCIVFYATTYLSGQLIYKALGRREDSEVVASTSGWHMPLLHLMGGLLLLGPLTWNRPAAHNDKPLAILYALVGSVWIVHAVFRLVGNLRRLRRRSTNTGQPQSPPTADQPPADGSA